MIGKLLRKYQIPNPRSMFIDMLCLRLGEMPPWHHHGKPYGYHAIIIPTRTEKTIALMVDVYHTTGDRLKVVVQTVEGGLALTFWEKRKLSKAASEYASRSYRHFKAKTEAAELEKALDGIEALIGRPDSEKDHLN